MQALKTLSTMSCNLLVRNAAFCKNNKGEIIENAKIQLTDGYTGPDIHIVSFIRNLIKKYESTESISVGDFVCLSI
jgi:hypothetical protein